MSTCRTTSMASTVPSLSYQSIDLRPDYRKLVFATEYHFKDDALINVEEKYVTALQKLSINYPVPLVWDRKTHLFRITCHQDIAMHVTQACLGTLREITDHQIGINDDDEESDVDMVADGESSDPEEDESDVEQDEGAQSTSNIVPLKKIKDFSISIESELAEALLRYPQSLNGYTYKKSWKREDSNGFALVAADAVLQEIGLLTNARLARHPYQNVIYVGSDNKESCDKAVSKLEVLFRYAEINSTRSHLFYSENFELIKIALCPLYDCKKRLLESTYFDNSTQYIYGNFAGMLRPKMKVLDSKRSLYQAFKESKHVAVTAVASKHFPLRYWQDWTYESHSATAWLNNVPKQAKGTLGSVGTLTDTSKSLITESSSTSNEVIDVRHAHKPAATIVDWVQALPAVTADVTQNSTENTNKPAWDTYTEYGEGQVVPINRIERRPFDSHKTIQITGYASTATPQTQVASTAFSIITRRPNVVRVNSTRNVQSRSYLKTTIAPTILDEAVPALLNFPSLLEMSGGMTATIHHPSPNPILPRVDPDMPLIDLSDDAPRQENPPSIQEPLSRVFYNTMNQRAPRRAADPKKTIVRLPLPSPPPAPKRKVEDDPNYVFLGQLESAVENALRIARGHSGVLVVRATFGRVFVSHIAQKLIQTENKDIDHFADFLTRTLQDPSVIKYFTKVITWVPQDVQYMIDLEENGERLWQSEEAFHWSAMYCFHFVTRETQQSFIIEMQVDSLNWIVKSNQCDFGSINVHGVGRQWDFVVEVNGFPNQNDQYDHLANTIKNSLTVPKNQTRPDLTFYLSDEQEARFNLVSLRTKRTLQFKHRQYNALLNVHEFQDLVMRSRTVDDNEEYNARASPDQNAPDHLYSWYETSISCPPIDSALKVSQTLEIGEEASWTSEEVSDFVENLIRPACQMLKQMDGVGYYNDNGCKKSDFAPPRPETPEEVFW